MLESVKVVLSCEVLIGAPGLLRSTDALLRRLGDGEPYQGAGEVNLFGEENWAELQTYGVRFFEQLCGEARPRGGAFAYL